MKFFAVLVALVSVAYAQEQCSCAPQPITIQLSCNGGQQQLPPPPPPAQEEPGHEMPPYEELPPFEEQPPFEEPPQDFFPPEALPPPDMVEGMPQDFCTFDGNGYPVHPELFPAGFHMIFHAADSYVEAHADVPFQRPPSTWNGHMESLDYPMPDFGTQDWNVLMCWPLPILTVPHDGYMDYGMYTPTMEGEFEAGR